MGACENSAPKPDRDAIRKEIAAMEAEFAKFLKDSGVAKAFYKYAAPDAVIKRGNDTLIIGKKAIGDYYARPEYATAVAEWSPDFVDISEDGTMAYTYGKYTWRFPGEDEGRWLAGGRTRRDARRLVGRERHQDEGSAAGSEAEVVRRGLASERLFPAGRQGLDFRSF